MRANHSPGKPTEANPIPPTNNVIASHLRRLCQTRSKATTLMLSSPPRDQDDNADTNPSVIKPANIQCKVLFAVSRYQSASIGIVMAVATANSLLPSYWLPGGP